MCVCVCVCVCVCTVWKHRALLSTRFYFSCFFSYTQYVLLSFGFSHRLEWGHQCYSDRDSPLGHTLPRNIIPQGVCEKVTSD